MRLFIALELDAALHPTWSALLDRLRAAAPKARVSSPSHPHLTLAFLGEQPEARLTDIQGALEDAMRGGSAFDAELRGLGTFGAPSHPRVLWMGLGEGADALAATQQRLTEGLARCGIALEERPFRAHLTLARARTPRGDAMLAHLAERHRDERLGTMSVTQLTLFQSTLGRGGAQHQALHRAGWAAP
jgi:2'-5' RNA ligase